MGKITQSYERPILMYFYNYIRQKFSTTDWNIESAKLYK
jgi:hypothetical protein